MKERKVQLSLLADDSPANPGLLSYSVREPAGDLLRPFCEWTHMADTMLPEDFSSLRIGPLSSVCSNTNRLLE